MTNPKFLYGLDRLKFDDELLGYIEKGSFDWGGKEPESVDIEAEQVPDAPVLSLVQKNGTVAPEFNLIQLDYENLQRVLGGNLVTSGDGASARTTGWQAPSELVELTGPVQIDTTSGKRINIPHASLKANLDGKLTLSEVSKVKVKLTVLKPAGGGAPYEIINTPVEG